MQKIVGSSGIRNFKNEFEFVIDDLDVVILGDNKFMFYDHDRLKSDDKMFWFWIHTSLISGSVLTLAKHDLDGAIKDKKNAHFPAEFSIELFFMPMLSDRRSSLTQKNGSQKPFVPPPPPPEDDLPPPPPDALDSEDEEDDEVDGFENDE